MRELVRFAPVLASDLDIDSKQQAISGLRATLGGASREVLEAAFVALVRIDRDVATTTGFVMFARLAGQMPGLASGLLAQLTPPPPPMVEQCLAWLAGEDKLIGMLAAEALGEQGPGAVPQLLAHLQPELGRERGWWTQERVRYYIGHALGRIGPGAAAAIPALIGLLDDEGAYRDTRWQAKKALVAIGPAAAQALFEELRVAPRWGVLEALSEMRDGTLASLVGLAALLDALRCDDESDLQGISAAILHRLR